MQPLHLVIIRVLAKLTEENLVKQLAVGVVLHAAPSSIQFGFKFR